MYLLKVGLVMSDAKSLIQRISHDLAVDKSFDLVRRDIMIADREAALFFVDGFTKDEVYEKMMEFLLKRKPSDLKGIKTMEEFSKHYMPYIEVAFQYNVEEMETAVLSGQSVLIVDGIEGALLVDTREYPVRSIEEPEKDKSLRGSRDGFVETLIFNTAMIRRRIRDPRLRMEYVRIGKVSKVDLCISYVDGIADRKVVNKLKKRLGELELNNVSMTSQALSETLVPTNYFNPFPKIKFTERPDYASACILEGRIALVMDNSPSVMLFATSFSDFTKEVDDYYFAPITATFIRLVRTAVSLATVFLTPVMLYLLNNQEVIPKWLEFIMIYKKTPITVFWQFVILEFIIDGLRLASMNTPTALSGSFGIIGGLLLSDFAIDAGWFLPETIIYMSFVAIASFSQPSYEMGYAMKFSRLLLLVFTQLFGLYGLIGGTVLIVIIMMSSETLSGRGYFYPIIPFNFKDFAKMFVRTKIKKGH